jgi:hypothetical protein
MEIVMGGVVTVYCLMRRQMDGYWVEAVGILGQENRKDITLQYGKALHGLGLEDDVYWREGSLKAI